MRFRVATWLRHRRASIVAVAIVIGALSGLALGLAAGTRRTASAPDRLTERAGGDPDMQITQMAGDPLIEAIGALPGVTSAAGYTFVLAFPLSPVDGAPLTDLNPFAGSDDLVGARIVDGRFTDPGHPDEFTVNKTLGDELRSRFGTKVGDRFPIVAFARSQLRSDLDLFTATPEVPQFEATLVGVTESPSDFDETGAQLVFSRSFLREHSDVGVIQTLVAARLQEGQSQRAVLDAVRTLPGGADAYSGPLRVVSDSARRAVHFQVVALWLVSALALMAVGVVATLIVGRVLRVGDDELLAVRALGWTRLDLSIERSIEGAAIGLVAGPVAAIVAWATTAAFPLGVIRAFEPRPGPRFDPLVTLVGLGGIVVVTATAGLLIARRDPARATLRTTPASLRVGGVSSSVALSFVGVNARGRRRWTPIVLGAIALAGVVGASVVGLSLRAVVGHPDRWGVNFDRLFGNPYAPAERDPVAPIVDLPEVAAATGATIGSVTVNGSDIAAFAFEPAKGRLVPEVVSGREPRAAGEIGLGAEVARRLGVEVGGQVQVTGTTEQTRNFEVVGFVVTPGSAGDGAAMSFADFETLNPGATMNVVLVDFVDGGTAESVQVVSDAVYTPPSALTTPTTIKALERVTAAPFVLCAVFGVLLVVSGAYLLSTSLATRRREFATLRALGAQRGQLRGVVHWYATLVTAAVVALGPPIGIASGRRVAHLIVSTFGIVPGVETPPAMVLAIVGGSLLVANVVALVPAHRASRTVALPSRA